MKNCFLKFALKHLSKDLGQISNLLLRRKLVMCKHTVKDNDILLGVMETSLYDFCMHSI